MPVQPTYPGVYIQEVSTGMRTISGVETSITAFIGRALRGPVNLPTTITSFSEYERSFGGLSVDSTMSYCVRDFFLNGGSTAMIVRIMNGAAKAAVTLPTEDSSPQNFNLYAINEGAWGNSISVKVDHSTSGPTNSTAGPSQDLFNLFVYFQNSKVDEYRNVSLKETNARFLPRILEQSSQLIAVRKDHMGEWIVTSNRPAATLAPVAASGGDDGNVLTTTAYCGNAEDKTGIYALDKAAVFFNLLCIPPPTRLLDTDITVYQAALLICVRKRAMLLVDPPYAWGSTASTVTATSNAMAGLNTLNLSGTGASNAALYFPRVKQADPNSGNQVDVFVPSGMVAGIFSKTDNNRGVWKSPAGIDAVINVIQGLQVKLTDLENGQLNPLGINCLRSFPGKGTVVWGARTLRGSDQMADEYKYIPVRRTALFIEESLYQGTQWVVFEPNDEPLWEQIRSNVGAFLHSLFLQGAFQGATPKEAYMVNCGMDTTSQNDINLGIVNIVVGFAALKPAEFVILKIQQLAGRTES